MDKSHDSSYCDTELYNDAANVDTSRKKGAITS